jgi:hypothetical protein
LKHVIYIEKWLYQRKKARKGIATGEGDTVWFTR